MEKMKRKYILSHNDHIKLAIKQQLTYSYELIILVFDKIQRYNMILNTLYFGKTQKIWTASKKYELRASFKNFPGKLLHKNICTSDPSFRYCNTVVLQTFTPVNMKTMELIFSFHFQDHTFFWCSHTIFWSWCRW